MDKLSVGDNIPQKVMDLINISLGKLKTDDCVWGQYTFPDKTESFSFFSGRPNPDYWFKNALSVYTSCDEYISGYTDVFRIKKIVLGETKTKRGFWGSSSTSIIRLPELIVDSARTQKKNIDLLRIIYYPGSSNPRNYRFTKYDAMPFFRYEIISKEHERIYNYGEVFFVDKLDLKNYIDERNQYLAEKEKEEKIRREFEKKKMIEENQKRETISGLSIDDIWNS